MAHDGKLVAVIGDEDTVAGFVLAGVGQRGAQGKNYLVVDGKTKVSTIEEAFHNFTKRPDIGILLINQHIAREISDLLDKYSQPLPTILEIPSKDHPYDPSKDFIMKRVSHLLGGEGAGVGR